MYAGSYWNPFHVFASREVNKDENVKDLSVSLYVEEQYCAVTLVGQGFSRLGTTGASVYYGAAFKPVVGLSSVRRQRRLVGLTNILVTGIDKNIDPNDCKDSLFQSVRKGPSIRVVNLSNCPYYQDTLFKFSTTIIPVLVAILRGVRSSKDVQ